MYEIILTKSFKKSFKKIVKNKNFNKEEFEKVLNMLQNEIDIPEKYRDHALSGRYKGFRDVHIQPDLVLIGLNSILHFNATHHLSKG